MTPEFHGGVSQTGEAPDCDSGQTGSSPVLHPTFGSHSALWESLAVGHPLSRAPHANDPPYDRRRYQLFGSPPHGFCPALLHLTVAAAGDPSYSTVQHRHIRWSRKGSRSCVGGRFGPERGKGHLESRG